MASAMGDEPRDAGLFGDWLRDIAAMLRGTGGVEVPCGDCVGCCVSSYTIWLRPTDRVAYEAVPEARLLRARDQPPGHYLIGFDDDGRCAMLQSGGCRIYADRPQTCRDYDCRIFVAAGIEAGGEDKRVINERVRAWRFHYADDVELRIHAAVRAAAAFIRDHAAAFAGRAPTAPTGIAVLALKAHRVFLAPDVERQEPAVVAAALLAEARDFDTGTGGG